VVGWSKDSAMSASADTVAAAEVDDDNLEIGSDQPYVAQFNRY